MNSRSDSPEGDEVIMYDHAKEFVPNPKPFVTIRKVKSKVKQSLYTPWRRLGGYEYSSYSFTTSAQDGGEWSASRPGRALPPGKGPPVLIVQLAGWAPELVWTQRIEEKSFYPCRGSNPDRPVVPSVVRHYTAWANPAPHSSQNVTFCIELNIISPLKLTEAPKHCAADDQWLSTGRGFEFFWTRQGGTYFFGI
jgi:hypothetical protein